MGFHRHRVEKAIQILGEDDKQVYLNQAITCERMQCVDVIGH